MYNQSATDIIMGVLADAKNEYDACYTVEADELLEIAYRLMMEYAGMIPAYVRAEYNRVDAIITAGL